jgi:hypothetical protein
MAKRILNRKDLRADFDAAERRKTDDEPEEAEGEVDADAEEEEEEDGEEGEDEEAQGDVEAGDDEDEEEAPKPKKKKAAPKPKAPKKTRSRTAKITRMKVVWGVFNNSNQCVATFDYPKKKEADELVAKLTAEKKNTHFLQPVKEPLEEKEKEK